MCNRRYAVVDVSGAARRQDVSLLRREPTTAEDAVASEAVSMRLDVVGAGVAVVVAIGAVGTGGAEPHDGRDVRVIDSRSGEGGDLCPPFIRATRGTARACSSGRGHPGWR